MLSLNLVPVASPRLLIVKVSGRLASLGLMKEGVPVAVPVTVRSSNAVEDTEPCCRHIAIINIAFINIIVINGPSGD